MFNCLKILTRIVDQLTEFMQQLILARTLMSLKDSCCSVNMLQKVH